MNGIPFAVHLGGGLYIDSDGKLHQSMPPSTPIYEAPFQAPGRSQKVKDALSDVKKALKDINKDQDVIEKFEEFGLPLKFLDILSGVGKVAGMVASPSLWLHPSPSTC